MSLHNHTVYFYKSNSFFVWIYSYMEIIVFHGR